MQKKVKILKADFDETQNVVIWEVLFDDGKKMKLVNKADELIKNLLNKPNLTVTKEMILFFNKNIEGQYKLMDFVSVNNSIQGVDKDKIEEFKSCLDEFPLREAAKLAEKEEK